MARLWRGRGERSPDQAKRSSRTETRPSPGELPYASPRPNIGDFDYSEYTPSDVLARANKIFTADCDGHLLLVVCQSRRWLA
ncbi:hypothetical protein F4776DRAFT_632744 [Hypoxylon sp. NC0597]|nr:hypothetical protein F4776DRAFT_632744 [Hypoxylon sp. NC0597]